LCNVNRGTENEKSEILQKKIDALVEIFGEAWFMIERKDYKKAVEAGKGAKKIKMVDVDDKKIIQGQERQLPQSLSEF
jgi:hypothetical protein